MIIDNADDAEMFFGPDKTTVRDLSMYQDRLLQRLSADTSLIAITELSL